MSEPAIEELKLKLKEFAQVRDWEQFHSPKNLSMALSVEASELVEHFQWMTEAQSADLSPQRHAAVAFEMADIFIFLLRLSDQLNVDLMEITKRKMELNNKRYPVDKVKGSSKKYNEYD
ncbi:MAG: nucleotide pyrophosphohydrolase [Gammaproteobacteria bacterium]|jgi:NTP pyrophosphatase (non-canonical NTP hydrolase)|nr:nucleotide pyrophosphohydrolase [Gammaproteobacteria bacterium]